MKRAQRLGWACLSWVCVALLATGCMKDSDGGDGDGAGGVPGQAGCEYQGMTYPEGAQVPAGDGCNTCQCQDGMVGSCTEVACMPPACTEEDCGPAPGVPSFLCDDGVTMAGRGPCERQENGQCGWTVSECPEDPCADILCPDGQACQAGACVEVGPCEPAECGEPPPTTSMLCPDGETQTGLGPCERGADGVCAWTYIECPEDECAGVMCEDGMACVDGECVPVACEPEACGPAPRLPDRLCEDGETMAGVGDCERQEGGECGWTITRCPDLCEMIQCERGAMCVEGECVDDPDRCVPGEQVPAGDGCNTCVCPESGLTAEADDCTLAVCENDCRADADCPDAQYCDFPNDDCGVFGGAGTCRERTNDPCPPGGVGACGCNGDQAFNGCDLSNAGTDINRYGGCLLELIGAEGFLCGHMNCDAESEYCYIAMNDVAGPNEPDFFARCEPLPAGCEQGDCDCLGLPEFPQFECYDDNGYSIAFDPGG